MKFNFYNKKACTKIIATAIGLVLMTSACGTVNNSNVVDEPKMDIVEIPLIEEEPIKEEPVKEEITKKVVALTFDDGPGVYTSQLVSILKENDASATFFLVGQNINNHKQAVIDIYKFGNEIAIHTYSHKSFTKMTINEIQNEINQTANLISGLGAEYSNYVRPPYGNINNEIMNNIDTTFVLWNVDPRDWESRNKDKVKEEILNNIADGNIILFHDIYESTVLAVAEILPLLSDEYEFVSVSELYEIKGQTPKVNQKVFSIK